MLDQICQRIKEESERRKKHVDLCEWEDMHLQCPEVSALIDVGQMAIDLRLLQKQKTHLNVLHVHVRC